MGTFSARPSSDSPTGYASTETPQANDWHGFCFVLNMLGELRRELAERTGLPEGKAEEAAKIVLRSILRRADGKEAEALVAHLPAEWKADFRDLGPGFDASVTSSTILGELGKFLGASSVDTQRFLPWITIALAQFLPHDELFAAFATLPFDIREKIDIGDNRIYEKDLDVMAVKPSLPGVGVTTLEPFLNKRILILKRSDTLRTASIAMSENNVGCVLVSNARGDLVGVLTDRDLACTVSVLEKGLESPIEDAMSDGIVLASEDSGLQTVVQLMLDHGIRRVPIVTHPTRANSRCIGMVTLDDLLATEAISVEQARRIVRQQMNPKPHRPSRASVRSAARREQTQLRFRRTLAERLFLDEERAEAVAKIILRALVRRVHYNEAAQFIAQLPALWQDELGSLPAGPDRSIHANDVLNHIMSYLDVPRERAVALFFLTIEAVRELTSPGEVSDLFSQLPRDMQELLREPTQRATPGL